MKMYSLSIIIRPASLPVVAGAAPTIEDWSVSEGTKVREAVTQTPHTEGTAHNYTATADQHTSAHAVLINYVYYFWMYVLTTRHS